MTCFTVLYNCQKHHEFRPPLSPLSKGKRSERPWTHYRKKGFIFKSVKGHLGLIIFLWDPPSTPFRSNIPRLFNISRQEGQTVVRPVCGCKMDKYKCSSESENFKS